MDVASMVEEDSFEYTGYYHDGMARVCSSFVVEMYKQGGLFGNLTINSAEFTPRDLYQLNIFHKDFQRPEECVKADPDVPYC